MAFVRKNFVLGRGTSHGIPLSETPSKPFTGQSGASAIHQYASTTDTIAEIAAPGYFDNFDITDPKPENFEGPLIRFGDFLLVKGADMPNALVFTSSEPPYTTMTTQGPPPENSVGTAQLQDGAVTLEKLAPALQPSNVIKKANYFAYGGGSATVTISGLTGVTGSDFAFVSIFSKTNPVTIETITAGMDEILVVLSGDPGVSTFAYQVVGG